jgi:hypothetical protein
MHQILHCDKHYNFISCSFFFCSFFFTWKVHRPPSSTVAHRQTLLLRRTPSTGDPPSTSNWRLVATADIKPKIKKALQINAFDAVVPLRWSAATKTHWSNRTMIGDTTTVNKERNEAARRSIEGGGGWSGRRKLLILFCRLCCFGFFFKQEGWTRG